MYSVLSLIPWIEQQREKRAGFYFFMTRKRVRLLPRPAGLSLAGSTSGYSSWAPGSSGTSAVKARCTLITLGCADTLLGRTPNSLQVERPESLTDTAKEHTAEPWTQRWYGTYPSRVICSFSCFKARGPAGTSSCDMAFRIDSLDDPACKQTASKICISTQHWYLKKSVLHCRTPTPKFHIILIARGKVLSEQHVRDRAVPTSSSSSLSSTRELLLSFGGANGAAASYTAALEPFPIWLPIM